MMLKDDGDRRQGGWCSSTQVPRTKFVPRFSNWQSQGKSRSESMTTENNAVGTEPALMSSTLEQDDLSKIPTDTGHLETESRTYRTQQDGTEKTFGSNSKKNLLLSDGKSQKINTARSNYRGTGKKTISPGSESGRHLKTPKTPKSFKKNFKKTTKIDNSFLNMQHKLIVEQMKKSKRQHLKNCKKLQENAAETSPETSVPRKDSNTSPPGQTKVNLKPTTNIDQPGLSHTANISNTFGQNPDKRKILIPLKTPTITPGKTLTITPGTLASYVEKTLKNSKFPRKKNGHRPVDNPNRFGQHPKGGNPKKSGRFLTKRAN
jgi:hypothetical protein